MNLLALLSPESLQALKQAKGTQAFFETRKSVWDKHQHIPGFPAWETFKRVLSAVL
jgi:hypothetical protein